MLSQSAPVVGFCNSTRGTFLEMNGRPERPVDSCSSTRSGTIRQIGPSHVRCGFVADASQGSHLNGVYVRWDVSGASLKASNDRYGIHPAFYLADDQHCGIATNVTELQKWSGTAELDDDAIAVFLRLGYYLGEDTPFRRIRALPPGSDLHWYAGKLQIDHSRACSVPQTKDIDRATARREFGRLFQEAVVELRQDAVTCVPLSGGQDSRHILLALMEAGYPPEFTITMQSPPPRISTDVQVALDLAGQLGLKHQVFPQPPNLFQREIRKNRLTGFCADEHAWLLPVADFCRLNAVTQAWDGLAGDYLSSGRLLDDQWLKWFRQGDLDVLAEVFLGDEGYLPACLTRDTRERWSRSVAKNRLIRELERHCRMPNPVMSFFFWNRVRRELALAPFGMLAQECSVITPFLHNRVFDFLVSLSPDLMMDQQFHIETIHETYPWMPSVPFLSISQFDNGLERASVIRRFCAELGIWSLPTGRRASRFVSRRFLIPRLLKGCVSRSFGTMLPIAFSRLIVLMQLERTLAEAGVSATQARMADFTRPGRPETAIP